MIFGITVLLHVERVDGLRNEVESFLLDLTFQHLGIGLSLLIGGGAMGTDVLIRREGELRVGVLGGLRLRGHEICNLGFLLVFDLLEENSALLGLSLYS